MISVGLSESEAKNHIARINQSAVSFGLSVACVNSPSNVTISGEERLIDMLEEELQQRDEKVFSRKLRVPVAYHSRQMESISAKYTSMLGTLSRPGPDDAVEPVPMISSVTGERVSPESLVDPRYWALNMTSTVQFSKAVTNMVAQAELVKKFDGSHKFASVVNHLIELGPHAALQSPIRSILSSSPRGPSISYSSAIRRGKPATDTLLRTIGELYCMGLSPDLRKANEPVGKDTSRSLLVHLPQYPFDHSKTHWHESRLSRRFRLRQHAPSELLGVMTPDSNPSDARWRHYIRLSESQWAEHHVIDGKTLYPAAGMIVFAIEAAKQLVATHFKRHIDSFILRDVRFEAPLDLSVGQLEVETSLHATAAGSGQGVLSFDFAVRRFNENDEECVACRGSISVELSSNSKEAKWERNKISEQREAISAQLRSMNREIAVPVDSQRMYTFLENSGLAYGTPFQNLREQRCNQGMPRQAAAQVGLFSPGPDMEPHVIHPATLDAVFHLCFTALTAGGQQPISTAVPSRVGCLWVSSTGLSQPDFQAMTACSSVQKSTTRGQTYDGGAFGGGPDMEVRVWFEGLETTNITSLPQNAFLSSPLDGELASPRPDQFYMTVSSKVALDKLSPIEVCSVLESMDKNGPSPWPADLDIYLLVALERLMSEVDFQSISEPEQWQTQFWKWTIYHLDRFRNDASLGWDDPQSPLNQTRANFELVGEAVASTSAIGHVFVKVAANLSKLVTKEIDPLDFLMRSGMLDDFYKQLADTQAADYVDLLAHQNPGLKILEVGGGTGGTTRRMIHALSSGGTGSLRCDRYDFTDISFAFFEKLREELALVIPQMTFGKLDAEKDIVEQGYEAGSYDLVVADNVLHATHDIPTTLSHIRRALKPGGKIVLNENIRTDAWTSGFIFGLLPGWWHGAGRGRELSPLLSAKDWDISLKASGFSGTDILLEKQQADGVSLLVSTAVVEQGTLSDLSRPPTLLNGQVFIVVDTGSVQQQNLANTLCSTFCETFGQKPIVLDLNLAAADGRARSPDDLVVSLLDYGSPFLSNLTETSWRALQGLIGESYRLLWLSGGGGKDPSPDYGIVDGLTRTLCFERYDLQFVTLGLDLRQCTEDPSQSIRHVVGVVREMEQARGQENYERDYTVVDDTLHIRRLLEANHVKAAMQQHLQPTKTTSSMVKNSRFQVSFELVPSGDTNPYYEEMQPWDGAPGVDEVEVSVKAVSLQPSERPAALGHLEKPQLGGLCSGVIVQAGSSSGFHPGERVVVVQAGSLRSHLRAPSGRVALIRPTMSFADVCATVAPLMAAHHALVDVGHVRPGDSVLIHGVDGPVGYALVDLLAYLGVTDVWATMTSQDGNKKDTFAAELLRGGFPEDRLIPQSCIDNSSILSSQWKRRFDTVVSPYPASQEILNSSCLRSGGRYILLQTWPSNAAQQIRDAPASASLSLVEHSTASQSVESLRYVTAALHRFRQVSAEAESSHTALFAAPKLNDALARLQHITERDSVIITYEDSDTIQVSI
jgi:malonyl CoA-acyl carrier protein transacylase